MVKSSYLEGLKLGFGFLTVLVVMFGLVYAAGFHYPNEIVPGGFQSGNYWFNGSLGIGTNSPSSKLDVDIGIGNDGVIASFTAPSYDSIDIGVTGAKGYIMTRSTSPFYFGVNSTNYMTIVNGGNVGIGTTSPQANLDIRAVNGANVYLLDSSDANRGLVFNTGNVTQGYSFITTNSVNRDLALGVDGAIDVFIHDNDNVGIGTTTPLTKLHVVGDIRSDGLVWIGGGAYLQRAVTCPSGTVQVACEAGTCLCWSGN